MLKPKAIRHFALAISMTLIGWCAPALAADTPDADASAIEAAADRWADAYNRGAVEEIAAMYTDDAKLLPEGSEAIVGRAAILEFFRMLRGAQPPETIRFSHFEFYGRDPVVTEHSEFEIRDRNGKIKYRGKQVLIRQKQNGQWKIHRDIWTGNSAAKP